MATAHSTSCARLRASQPIHVLHMLCHGDLDETRGGVLIFEDAEGHELCKIQERMLRIKDTMEIEGPNGENMATVKKALITPVRERFTAKIGNGPDMDIQGNILDHEYTIEVGRNKIAEVSKKWFRVRDTYGVEIEPGQNDILILAMTACVDQMAH